jgi:hypothetical protein
MFELITNLNSVELDLAYLSADTTPAERIEITAEIYKRKAEYRRATQQVTITVEA